MTLEETPSKKPTTLNQISSFKKLRFHEIDIKNVRARRNYNVDVSLTIAESRCRSDSYTLEDCLDAVNEAELRLDKKIKDAEEQKLLAEKLQVEKEANRIQEERNSIELIKALREKEEKRIIIYRPRHPLHHSPHDPKIIDPQTPDNKPIIDPDKAIFDFPGKKNKPH